MKLADNIEPLMNGNTCKIIIIDSKFEYSHKNNNNCIEIGIRKHRNKESIFLSFKAIIN